MFYLCRKYILERSDCNHLKKIWKITVIRDNDLSQPSLIRKIFKAGKTCEQTGSIRQFYTFS